MAGFVQIIEFQTSRYNEVKQVADDYRAKREADARGPMPVRSTVTRDRKRPGVYLNIVEFESYEAAMENSGRPDTNDFAKHMMELCDGEPKYYDLDVVDAWMT
jgi:hypothetical protein